jgi:hypothetical protein
MAYFQSFLVQYEGEEDLKSKANKTKQLLIDMEIEDYDNPANYPNQYIIELGEVNGIQTIIILNN